MLSHPLLSIRSTIRAFWWSLWIGVALGRAAPNDPPAVHPAGDPAAVGVLLAAQAAGCASLHPASWDGVAPIEAAGPPRPRPRSPIEAAPPALARSGPGPSPSAAILPPAAVIPLDLGTALRLAEAVNPEIALSREAIRGTLALRQGARALLLPSLNAGGNYHGHTGPVQKSTG